MARTVTTLPGGCLQVSDVKVKFGSETQMTRIDWKPNPPTCDGAKAWVKRIRETELHEAKHVKIVEDAVKAANMAWTNEASFKVCGPNPTQQTNDEISKRFWKTYKALGGTVTKEFLKLDARETTGPLACQPDLELNTSGNLGGASEAKTELLSEAETLSPKCYRFTFSDPNTRSLLFVNGFFDQHQAGRDIGVHARWKDGAGAWQEEDWSGFKFIGLCRDLKAERTTDLTIIVTNGDLQSGGKITASAAPYLKRNNMGCWKYQGTATTLRKHQGWTGLGQRTESNLSFELDPLFMVGSGAKHPHIPNSLRAGLATFLSLSGTNYRFEQSYKDGPGCTYTTKPVTFPLSLIPTRGFMQTNPFPELEATDDPLLQNWLAQARGAYSGFAAGFDSVVVSITGDRACTHTDTETIGDLLMTDQDSLPAVVTPNGEMRGHSTFLNDWRYDWVLRPQRQP